MKSIKRDLFDTIKNRLAAEVKTIQVIVGPRQVGKTTLIKQIMDSFSYKNFYHTADSPRPLDTSWIEQHWMTTRLVAGQANEPVLLCFDEIQKITGWSDVVKKYFDEDRQAGRDIRVVISGSSSVQLETGLSDSLAGRFEKLMATHWTYEECQRAFDVTLEEYIRFGGYPGAYAFIKDPDRWVGFIQDSLVEPVMSKDILMRHPVRKPVLLRRLFDLACVYGGQVMSYQKLLGQLQDAGNVTTLAHYQHLLEQALLICGIQKYSGSHVRKRASSPKWIPLNTALMTAAVTPDPYALKPGSVEWGRLTEAAVGAHLINQTLGRRMTVYYWNEGYDEVDFVLEYGDKLVALEVKSGPDGSSHRGLAAFKARYPEAVPVKLGGDGLDLELFFKMDPLALLSV